MTRTAITVRAAEPSDLDAIVRIDGKLSGQTRKPYWQQRLEIAALRPPWMSLVQKTYAGFARYAGTVVLPARLGKARPGPPA